MSTEISRNEYVEIHRWIRNNYGKATYCSNNDCISVNPKRFEWALITGKNYERNINNYIPLCPSCHRKYDKANVGIKRSKDETNRIKDMNKKPVLCYDNNGNLIAEYDSISLASEEMGINRTSISQVLNNHIPHVKKLIWKYKN